MGAMTIQNWRKKIDAIDATLLRLLNRRAEYAIEVGKLKGERGLSLWAPAREHEILSQMEKLNPGPLDSEAIIKIYRLILIESRRIQERHGGRENGRGNGRRSRAHGIRKQANLE
jgi:chorismate mutase-like protein